MYVIAYDRTKEEKPLEFVLAQKLEELEDRPLFDIFVSVNKYRKALATIEFLKKELLDIQTKCATANRHALDRQDELDYINKYYL